MQTQLQPPLAPPNPPPSASEPGRRRRWPRLVLIAGALVSTLALITGATWIARYDPLTRGSLGWAPPPGVDARVVDVSYALTDAPRIFLIPAVTGMIFPYRFSIKNDGPVSI